MSKAFYAMAGLVSPIVSMGQVESMRWPVSESITRVNYAMDNDKAVDKILDYKCGTKSYDSHRGTDIGAGRNSDVYAAASGWVQSRADGFGDGFLGSQDGNGFGNHVVLFHDPDYNSIYGHFTSGSGIPNKNDTIECGTRIGASGTSGNSSGPHMHFEIRLNVTKTNYYSGTEVDPFSGECSTPKSYWRSLNAAGVPSTSCESPVLIQSENSQHGSTQSHFLFWNGRSSIYLNPPLSIRNRNLPITLELFNSDGKRLCTPKVEWMADGQTIHLVDDIAIPPGRVFGRLSIGEEWHEILNFIHTK